MGMYQLDHMVKIARADEIVNMTLVSSFPKQIGERGLKIG